MHYLSVGIIRAVLKDNLPAFKKLIGRSNVEVGCIDDDNSTAEGAEFSIAAPNGFEDIYTSITISDFPFCCGLAVIGHLDELDENQKSLNTKFIKTVTEALSKTGVVFATTIADQYEANASLPKAGFKRLFLFNNPNTGTDVTVWAKFLVPRIPANRKQS